MDPLSIILALGAITVAVYYYFTRENVYEKHGIPCDKGIPIFGSNWKLLLQRASMLDMAKESYDIHKEAKYVVFYDFMYPTIVLRDLELIKTVTVKNFDHFVNHRSFGLEKNEPLFSQNLFFLKDERWREVRNSVSPVFTSSKMKTMFVLMSDCAKKYGETLANLPDGQKEIELKATFTRYTNDVIATCAFGIEIDSMKDPDNAFYVYGTSFNNMTKTRMLKFFIMRSITWLAALLKLKIIDQEIENFFVDLIGNNIKAREEQGLKRPDIIQTLLENRYKLGPGKEITTQDITAQALIFFLAGFDPVASAMSFAAYELGLNREVQQKLQEEIDQVLANQGDVTYDAIMSMKYLDAVVNEALRMYPIQPFTDRVCSKSFELPPALPGGKPFVVEKGTYVHVPIYGIQRDEKYYKNPDKFDPERFFGDAKTDLNPNTLMAFGLGPRMCIGNRFALLEIKVLLFHVFAKCNLVPCPRTSIPLVLDKTQFNMRPINGFWFEIQPRKETGRAYEHVNARTGVY